VELMCQFNSSFPALGPAYASDFLPAQPCKSMVLVEEHSCTRKLSVCLVMGAVEHPSEAGCKMKAFIPQLRTVCQEACSCIGMRENYVAYVSLLLFLWCA